MHEMTIKMFQYWGERATRNEGKTSRHKSEIKHCFEQILKMSLAQEEEKSTTTNYWLWKNLNKTKVIENTYEAGAGTE